MKKILLVEDDFDFSTILKHYLELHNFEVVCAVNGINALEIFEKNVFDICILDIMMPLMDGFTLSKEISRKYPETPFLFLTAKKLKEDIIKGLQLGADDYIIKPFEVEELILRLQNILKRSDQKKIKKNEIQEIYIGKYLFNTQRLNLKLENKTQQLTEKEALLIKFLFTNRNQLIKRETILNEIWQTTDFFSGRSMDVFISKIRKYFQDDDNISIESTRFIGLEFKIKK